MPGQSDTPLPGDVPGTDDGDEVVISEGSSSRLNAITPPAAAVPNTTDNKAMITEGSSSQPNADAPNAATPGDATGNSPIALGESEYKLGRGEDQNKTTAQIRFDSWTDGMLTGFLGYENRHCVEGGFDALRLCISNFARSMTETVEWGSLNVEAQQMLKSWAPKAKKYLETSDGARGKTCS
jgi:hypothetical protein